MISQFSAIHAIAARRGDGLRPELLQLLETGRREAEGSPRLVAGNALPKGALRFPTERDGQWTSSQAEGTESEP